MEQKKQLVKYQGKYEAREPGQYGWFDISKEMYQAYVDGTFQGLMLDIRQVPIEPVKEQEETVEQAANMYSYEPGFLIVDPIRQHKLKAFIAGAKWQAIQKHKEAVAVVDDLKAKHNVMYQAQKEEIERLREALKEIEHLLDQSDDYETTAPIMNRIATNALNQTK